VPKGRECDVRATCFTPIAVACTREEQQDRVEPCHRGTGAESHLGGHNSASLVTVEMLTW